MRTISARATTLLASAVLLATGLAHGAERRIEVLTGLQSTYSIAVALAKRTEIEPREVFGPNTRMARQSAQLEKRADEMVTLARSADAVIDIRSVWAGDPLFPRMRRHNIRIVEIDAATSFDPTVGSVALIGREGGPGYATNIWLSPANGLKMAEIVAADFARLSPSDAPVIEANLDAFKAEIFNLMRRYQARFAALDDLFVVLLAEELAYLVRAMEIEVSSIVEPEGSWSEPDLVRLRQVLAEVAPPVVVTKWDPEAPVAEIIRTSGARLAVLNTMDPGMPGDQATLDPRGYQKTLRYNLDVLFGAFTGERTSR